MNKAEELFEPILAILRKNGISASLALQADLHECLKVAALAKYDRVEKAESDLAALQRKIREQCIMNNEYGKPWWCQIHGRPLKMCAPDCLVRDVMEGKVNLEQICAIAGKTRR